MERGLDVTNAVIANQVDKFQQRTVAAVRAKAVRNVARMFDMVEPKLDWGRFAQDRGGCVARRRRSSSRLPAGRSQRPGRS
jgi:hypothetical protein